MAGGWSSRPFVPPLSPSRSPSRRSPDPGPGTSPSSHQENNHMSIATASDLETAPARPLLMPLLSATACVALADWLFYDWEIGISLALFLGVLGVVAIASNGVVAPRKTQIAMTAVFVAGLVAAIEDVDFLSVVVSTLATALFAIVVTDRETSSWQRRLFEALTIPFRGPLQL